MTRKVDSKGEEIALYVLTVLITRPLNISVRITEDSAGKMRNDLYFSNT